MAPSPCPLAQNPSWEKALQYAESQLLHAQAYANNSGFSTTGTHQPSPSPTWSSRSTAAQFFANQYDESGKYAESLLGQPAWFTPDAARQEDLREATQLSLFTTGSSMLPCYGQQDLFPLTPESDSSYSPQCSQLMNQDQGYNTLYFGAQNRLGSGSDQLLDYTTRSDTHGAQYFSHPLAFWAPVIPRHFCNIGKCSRSYQRKEHLLRHRRL